MKFLLLVALLVCAPLLIAASQCGTQGGGATCTSLGFPTYCCSSSGYCGTTSAYCGAGCQTAASAGHCTGSSVAATTTTTTAKAATTTTTTAKSTTTTGTTTGGATWPSGPLKAVYLDLFNGESISSRITSAISAGFNLIILGFYVGDSNTGGCTGACDAAALWLALGSSTQQSIITSAHNANVKITVSAGGATDTPYSMSATTYGQNVANFAVNNHLDGVDFDLENLGAGFTGGSLTASQTVSWIVTASNAARAIIGAAGNTINGKVLTHAPQSPYFGQTYFTTSTASYSVVYTTIPSVIDYLLVQYYNQGNCYFDCTSLFIDGSTCSASEPGTAVQQIENSGVPISKIIVGADVESDTPPRTAAFFCGCFKSNTFYNQGIMIYKYTDDGYTATYLSGIYGSC